MPLSPGELAEKARKLLLRRWRIAEGSTDEHTDKSPGLPDDIARDIHDSVNASTKTYRYVLPAQVIAKACDPSLDCRCIQVSRSGPGAFDARSLAHGVIVPFDRANENVLGGSPEPYANNPVRVPEISPAHRAAQKNKAGWDRLCRVLDAVEEHQDPQFTLAVLDHVLRAIRDRLEGASVAYAVPQRVSHTRLLPALQAYLAARSGGVRLQTIVAALFETIGTRFGIFAEVRSNKPTAADISTGQVADLECYDSSDRLALAVEVKDRELTLTQISDKTVLARGANVTELLFIAQRGIRKEEHDLIPEAVERQFASGHNVYIFDFEDFASGILALLGEVGRRDFLTRVGEVLERYQAPLSDRRAWAAALRDL